MAFLVIVGLSSIADENTSTNASTAVTTPTPTITLNAEPTPTSSTTPTPTPTPSPTPESPIDFRFAVIRDLDDMNKDISDALRGISEDGLGKYKWNVFEIVFNMQQLKMRVPQPEYEAKWNQVLEKLDSAVADLEDATDSDGLTISLAKQKLKNVQTKIPAVKSFAKTLAN